jgi:hypothetical protein
MTGEHRLNGATIPVGADFVEEVAGSDWLVMIPSS